MPVLAGREHGRHDADIVTLKASPLTATRMFLHRSLALNDESSLMILDEDVGQQMNAIFLDDLKHAEEIAPARFRQRPWVQRLLERPAGLVQRLL